MRAEAWRAELERPGKDGAPSYAHAHPELARAILEGIEQGVRIGFTGDRARSRTCVNLGSATKDDAVRAAISAIIAADVAAGKKAGPFDAPPFEFFSASPIGAVPKGLDAWRAIHHLSFPYGKDSCSINAGIAREELTLGRFDDACDAVRALGANCFLVKLDVEAAYKQVPVHPDDRALLGLRWEGKYYYELVLPFGLRTAGNRWEMYATALHFFFQHHLGVDVVIHYVDDFLFVVACKDRAQQHLADVLDLCARLGVPMASKKTEGPTTRLTFLGIELDTVAMEARLDAKRLSELQLLLGTWGERRGTTLRELQSLTGKLNFAATVVRRGRAYLRRLIDLQRAIKAQPGATPRTAHRLSNAALRDIQWWRDFLTQWNGRALLYEQQWTDAARIELFTDACNAGYGAHFGDRWFAGFWTKAQLQRARRGKRVSMPFLELHALVHAAAVWGHLWSGKKITFRSDCLPVVLAIRSMSSKQQDSMRLLRHLDAIAARHGFDFRCEHIAGVANTVADALSRDGSDLQARALRPSLLQHPDPSPPLPPLAWL